ncbi:MAG: ABC transporter substrate-binding protein [Anaerolineae bacterium]
MGLGACLKGALALLVVLMAGACGATATPVASPAAVGSPAATSVPGTLRIAVLPITDCVPFYVAEQQGYFAAEGINVELVAASSAAERDQLFVTGQADGGVSDLVATALFNASGSGLRAVRKTREATVDSPQFWILAPKGSTIASAADLAGVEIAVSQNSTIQYVTERLLQHAGLAADQIKTVNVPQIPVRFQLLDQGQVQAATLPDPFASLGLLQGAHTVIADSSYPEISLSVLVFRAPVVSERREDVSAFVAAYERALDDIRSDPAAFQDLLIEKGRVPEPLRGKYTFPPLPASEVPSEQQWQDVIDWALSKGLIAEALPYDQAVDSSFIR